MRSRSRSNRGFPLAYFLLFCLIFFIVTLWITAHAGAGDYYSQLRRKLLVGCADVCDTSDTGTTVGSVFAPIVHKRVDCVGLFSNSILDAQGKWPPPKRIPAALLDDFTMNGDYQLIEEKYNEWYAQRYSGDTAENSHWTRELVDRWVQLASRHELDGNYARSETVCMQRAFEKAEEEGVGVRGKHIAVLGSENPWVEAALLAAGAKHVTTVEYGKIVSTHPQISTITPKELAQSILADGIEAHQFDGWATFSSVEHSGLGRYGDELNPWGDLVASARMWCLTKDSGSLFIAVPMGSGSHMDAFHFNAHRIYGPRRFAQLFANWNQHFKSCGLQATHVLTKGQSKS